MFDLSVPWWELLARAALVYGALLAMVRVSGKRSVGQFTPFDLLVVMLLSEGVSNGLTGGEASVTGSLLIAATLIGCNALVGFIASRSRKAEAWIEGTPVLIARDGRVFEHTLRAHRVGRGDMEKALREADCREQDVQYAFLEADGNISILKKPPTA
ncbi:YetF domain-containing protein [Aquincola sp. MAHUQ-54]|uniref:YetF domain-containing protein n=1 Tax=Aquincola agrisoli TaxID=3119538 RepID=A0AAW9QMU3_9BURK